MNGLLNKLKKARGRGADELRVRGQQSLAALAERRGWSRAARLPTDAEFFRLFDAPRAARIHDDESLLEHFRTRTAPAFFASFADTAKTRAELEKRFGGRDKAHAVAHAERICDGRFDLLGLRDLSFGDPVDWHLEPVAGKRAPLAHWSEIDYLNPDLAGDKKITWELNRHQFFLTLGRAYWRTGDERYARKFVVYLNSWMDANPPKLGINWASSLEVAFRSIAWLWALYLFKDSPSLTPKLFSRALKFLYLNARHLETYLSTYFSPNTHLTGEALGLFYVGTLLPEMRDAARWRETGRRILIEQLERHILADGVYFEQASYYQRYTADFYTHLVALSRANGIEIENTLGEKLKALLEHLMFITRPDGTTPFIGDDDGGRLVMLDERPANDFRAALSTGAALFGREDFKHVAGDAAEETLWLLGPAGLESFDRLEARPPARTSRAFHDGGYYVMRDGWTPESNYLLMDCGPHGADNCGHAHADALSFDLAARGRTLLVDPGTYTYTGDAALRDYFRSTPAHNTLAVDGESSSAPAGPFTWAHVARARERTWVSRERFDFFEGEHDGYARLDDALSHARDVLFIKGGYWIMRDRINGAARPHLYELFFHFAPGAKPETTAEEGTPFVSESSVSAPGLEIVSFGDGGEWRGEEGWASFCYGSRESSQVRVFGATAAGGCEFVTFLMPRATEARAGVVVREREGEGGRVFDVSGVGDGVRDRVLLRDEVGGLINDGRLSADFAWTWARFARDGVALEELILINGRRLSFDGQIIINEPSPIAYAHARREGDQLIIETERQARVVRMQTEVTHA